MTTELRKLPEAAIERVPLLQKQTEGEIVFDLAAGRFQSATLKTDMLYVAVPVAHPSIAIVRVALPLTDVRDQLQTVLIATLTALGLALLGAAAIAWFFSARIGRRVRLIAGVAERYRAGDLTPPRLGYGNDELGTVARALDQSVQEMMQLARDAFHASARLGRDERAALERRGASNQLLYAHDRRRSARELDRAVSGPSDPSGSRVGQDGAGVLRTLRALGLRFARVGREDRRRERFDANLPRRVGPASACDLSLRAEVESMIANKVAARRLELQTQLNELLEISGNGNARGRGRGKERSVAAKYRNPKNSDEVWSGRGRMPFWLGAELKAGKAREDFLIA